MSPKLLEPRTRRWTLPEYYRLAEDGYFHGQRVQLIRGEIIEMPAHGHPHFATLDRAAGILRDLFGDDCWVRAQGPLNVSSYSAPEPDLAVVAGSRESYRDHPTTALLVIEVSDSTLSRDRNIAGLYAAAGVPEYWILNVRERCVELHREPIPDDAQLDGFRYAQVRVLAAHESLAPLSLREKPIPVSSLFPSNV